MASEDTEAVAGRPAVCRFRGLCACLLSVSDGVFRVRGRSVDAALLSANGLVPDVRTRGIGYRSATHALEDVPAATLVPALVTMPHGAVALCYLLRHGTVGDAGEIVGRDI